MAKIRDLKKNSREYSSKEWFVVSQVENNIWAIREPHYYQDVVSYFIKGRDKDILIDTGTGLANIYNVLPITKESNSKNLTVFLTHTHWDHVGGTNFFADVRVFDNDFETLRLSRGWKPEEILEFEKHHNARISQSLSQNYPGIPGLKHFQTLKNNQRIDIGGDTLLVISTPGHSPGSVSYYLEKSRNLFTGDTFYVGPIYLHMKGSDYHQFLASIQKMELYLDKLNKIFPAHNDTSLTLQKFRELSVLIKGSKSPDFRVDGVDEFNKFTQYSWHMNDLGDNRRFSLLLPRGTSWPSSQKKSSA